MTARRPRRLALTLAAVALTACATSHAMPTADTRDGVVARVNGHPVLRKQAELLTALKLRKDSEAASHYALAYETAVAELVRRELLCQEAASRGFRADPARADGAFQAFRASFADEKDLAAFLKRLDFDVAGYRAELRAQATADELLEADAEKKIPAVTDDEVVRIYSMYNRGAGRPTGATLESWRHEIKRKEEAMVMRTFMDELSAKAKIEKTSAARPGQPPAANRD